MLNAVFCLMPRQLTKIVIFATCMFALVFELIVNIYLGTETFSEIEQYEESYKLCYVRGPEGIILVLAEKIK